MGWGGVGWDEMELAGVGWTCGKWNGMRWNWIGLDWVGLDGMGRDGMGWRREEDRTGDAEGVGHPSHPSHLLCGAQNSGDELPQSSHKPHESHDA